MKNYTITMNKEQAEIIRGALNFYFNSFLGQLNLHHIKVNGEVLDCGGGTALENMLQHLMKVQGWKPSGRISDNVPKEAKNALDIHDVILHQLWKDGSCMPIQLGEYELPVIEESK